MADYAPPSNGNRQVSGIAIWGAAAALSYYTPGTTNTASRLIAADGAAGTCGSNPAAILQNTNAQQVSFTFKTTVPLSAGQIVVWEETTSVEWKLASIPTNAQSCTCAGHTTWTQTESNGFTRVSGSKFQVVMPTIANAATEVVCTAGDVVCTVRNWNAGAAPATDLASTCYACDSQGCTKANSKTTNGVVKQNDAATVTYKQGGTADATKLSIKDVGYYPNSKNARGRLSYKLLNTATAWAAETTVEYEFGA